MQLVEQTIIKKRDPRYAPIDAAAFAAKNLYNLALYEVRQAFIHESRYLSYALVYHLVKHTDAYQALPRKVSNDILRQLDKNWRAYFAALDAYRDDKSKFLGRPKMPRYKHKTAGRFLLIYDRQAISKTALKRGILAPSGLEIEVPTSHSNVKQARIVPRSSYYVIEVIYERAEHPPTGDPTWYASVDLGVNNLAAISSNKRPFTPRLVNGRPMKSTNQFYNKRKADLQHQLGTTGTTARMERLTTRRTRRINHYLHAASRAIIALLKAEGIGTLVIGKNALWKQKSELGRVNNQHFVQLPHARFIDMLEYKAKLVGIRVILQEESYTSQASALDLDPLPVYSPTDEEGHHFSGKRITRGLYRAADGRVLNADINGSANILRKALPKAFADGIEGIAACPAPLVVSTIQPRAPAGRRSAPTGRIGVY